MTAIESVGLLPLTGCGPLTGDRRRAAVAEIVANHYAHAFPSGKSHVFYVEGAIVVYSIPANNMLARFVLGRPGNVWELTRLWAPNGHERNLLTRAISVSLNALRRTERGIEAVVSYADPNVGHEGGIYRAASWVYTGQSEEARYYRDGNGQVVARRKFHSGSRHLSKSEIVALGYSELRLPGKHRFVKPLSRAAKRRVRDVWGGKSKQSEAVWHGPAAKSQLPHLGDGCLSMLRPALLPGRGAAQSTNGNKERTVTMGMGTKKKERRRVGKAEALAAVRRGGSGDRVWKLPAGVREWFPDKAGTATLDIIPYVTSLEDHPDRVEPGTLWWRLPYKTHRDIGPNKLTVACPTSINKPCPICEERSRLAQNWDDNEDAIKAIRASENEAYVIKDPDRKGALAVFGYSKFKFGDALQSELDERGETMINFYDVTDEGQTLDVRFSSEKFMGREFLKATRIDFKPRKPMDESIVDTAPVLEECLDVMDYDALKKLFLQIGDDGEAGDAPAARPQRTPDGSGGGKNGGGKKTAATPAPAATAAEPADDEPVPYAEGDRVKFVVDGKKVKGVVEDYDAATNTLEVLGDDGESHDVDLDDTEVKVLGKAEPAPAPEPEPAESQAAGDDSTDDDADDSTDDDADDDAGDDAGNEPDTEPGDADAGDEDADTIAVGDRVQEDGTGEILTVVKIEDDEATVKNAAGQKSVLDVDDLVKVADDATDAGDDDNDDEPAPVRFKVGDAVTWDGGSETGKVIKMSLDGSKITVENTDGVKEKLTPAELTHVSVAAAPKKKPAAAPPAKTGKKK